MSSLIGKLGAPSYINKPLYLDFTTATNANVNFNVTFNSPPYVLLSVNNANTDLVWSLSIVSVSKTGCTLSCKYRSATNFNTDTWHDFNSGIYVVALGYI